MNLPKIVKGRKKRVGSGYGSGKGGHTTGRGTKGQKARHKIPILFEGVKVKKSLIRRLPVRRGKGKFKGHDKPLIVKVEALNLLPSGSKVNIEILVKAGVINLGDAQKYGVKILGGGKVNKKLEVQLPISASAAKIIEKAGGHVKRGKVKL